MNKFVPPTLPHIEAVNSAKKTTVSNIKQKENKNPSNPMAKSSKKCSSLSEVIGGAQVFVPSAKPEGKKLPSKTKTSVAKPVLAFSMDNNINAMAMDNLPFISPLNKESNKTTQVCLASACYVLRVSTSLCLLSSSF